MKPAAIYTKLREIYPDKPFGRHWEGIGACVTDGVWGDPRELGMEGELDRIAKVAPEYIEKYWATIIQEPPGALLARS